MPVEAHLFAPGNTGEFLKTYERDAMAAQTGALGQPVGYYVNDRSAQPDHHHGPTALSTSASSAAKPVQRSGLAGVLKAPAADDHRRDALTDSAPFFRPPATRHSEHVMRSRLAAWFRAPMRALLCPRRCKIFRAADRSWCRLGRRRHDFTARVMVQKLSAGDRQQWSKIKVAPAVDRRNQVCTADGYTLLYHSVTGIVNAAVAKDLPFDYLRDLVPVALVTRFAAVMVINPGVEAKNLQEFIALAKANPGKFSYGSSGPGTGIHLASELFKLAAGVDIVHVPYRGNAGVMPDLLAGRIQMLIDGVPPQVKNIEGGLVRALGVLSKARTPALPNVPTMIEQGLDYEVPYWTAVYAPAATPKPIVEKLSTEIVRTMKDAEVIGKLKNVGTEAVGSTPAEMDAFNRQQFELYRKIVQNPNLKLGLQ